MAAHPPRPGDRVLDIGCGFGDTTRRLAELVGEGEAVGVDVAEPFIELAPRGGRGGRRRQRRVPRSATCRSPTSAAPTTTSSRGWGDVLRQPGGGAAQHARGDAARRARSASSSGGASSTTTGCWEAEQVVEKYLEHPEETDEPTCGPGPFSMADADTVTEQLRIAGFEAIELRRSDLPMTMGDDLDGAVDLTMAIGPAGEVLRLWGDRAEEIRPRIARRDPRGAGAVRDRRTASSRRPRPGSSRRSRLTATASEGPVSGGASAKRDGELGPGADAQLAVGGAQVVLDRARGEEEGRGDLAVGAARGDQLADVALAGGQRRGPASRRRRSPRRPPPPAAASSLAARSAQLRAPGVAKASLGGGELDAGVGAGGAPGAGARRARGACAPPRRASPARRGRPAPRRGWRRSPRPGRAAPGSGAPRRAPRRRRSARRRLPARRAPAAPPRARSSRTSASTRSAWLKRKAGSSVPWAAVWSRAARKCTAARSASPPSEGQLAERLLGAGEGRGQLHRLAQRQHPRGRRLAGLGVAAVAGDHRHRGQREGRRRSRRRARLGDLARLLGAGRGQRRGRRGAGAGWRGRRAAGPAASPRPPPGSPRPGGSAPARRRRGRPSRAGRGRRSPAPRGPARSGPRRRAPARAASSSSRARARARRG